MFLRFLSSHTFFFFSFMNRLDWKDKNRGKRWTRVLFIYMNMKTMYESAMRDFWKSTAAINPVFFRHTSEASALRMFSRRKCMRSFSRKIKSAQNRSLIFPLTPWHTAYVSALRNLPSPNAAVSNRSTGFSWNVPSHPPFGLRRTVLKT